MRITPDEIDQLRRGLDGRYVLGSQIGVGGMSAVFRARDTRHDRDVAVKVLAGPGAAHLGPRFLHEIRITASLQHPHILPLLESGAVGHIHFFVTPYIAGQSLGQHLVEHGALPLIDAIRLGKEVAGALAHAHTNGVVHLDVTPGNILLSDGHAIVADFGIARALSGGPWDSGGRGVPAGTPGYMSPEQVNGETSLDARSDIYSLGCVLFEMLTGEPPFQHDSPTEVLSKHLHAAPPSARERRRGVPRRVDLAVRRAMAKDPASRFASMNLFARALERRPVTLVRRGPIVRTPHGVRAAAAAVGVALVSLLGFSISKTTVPVGRDRIDPIAADLDDVRDQLPVDNGRTDRKDELPR